MPRTGKKPFANLPLQGAGSIVLWSEDCFVGMRRRLYPRSVDVVVTSPPYNLGVHYRSYKDSRPREEYLRWMGRMAEGVDRVLDDYGSWFLNMGGTPGDPWLPWDVARVISETFRLQNVIHWVKSIAIDRNAAGRSAGLERDLALGHYKPVSSLRYLHGAHEYVYHFTRRGDVPLDRLAVGVPYQDKTNIGRWTGATQDRRDRGNTWFLPYPTIQRRERDRPHPATFPPELPESCIKLHGIDRTRLVIDPFVGIGSSAVAAARLGVPFVGFDIDAEYLTTARERVERELGMEKPKPRAKQSPKERKE